MATKDDISKVCKALEIFLAEKNRRYGDSAMKPVNIFHKGLAAETINIRIDDKLSRIHNSEKLRKNDVVDLLGYLVLMCVDKQWLTFEDLLD